LTRDLGPLRGVFTPIPATAERSRKVQERPGGYYAAVLDQHSMGNRIDNPSFLLFDRYRKRCRRPIKRCRRPMLCQVVLGRRFCSTL
jgi:hypothetical protein